MKQKRNKEKFLKIVKESTQFQQSSTLLNIHQLRPCSKKARTHIKLYKCIKNFTNSHKEKDIVKINNYYVKEQRIKLDIKLKKKGKSH